MSKPDVYQMVTDRIVAQLEAGTVPWRQPWKVETGKPRNMDGRPYRGVNPLLLGLSALENGYRSPFWITYKQAQQRGGNVKKGESGTLVVFWKTLRVTDEDENGHKVAKSVPMLRYYYVFNLEQTENVKVPQRVLDWEAAQVKHEHEPLASAEEIVARYLDGGPSLTNGTVAQYTPATDVIVVPPRESFENGDEYYSTLFHEMAHSTGHPDRLDRPIKNKFGSHDYGREELVAEMGSAFLQAECGIETPFANSASYLAAWIATIKEDKRAVVVAAGAAQKAADLILGRDAAAESAAAKELATV